MRKFILIVAFFYGLSSPFICAQQLGNASYYNGNLKGRHTSDGGKYHPDSMTCAHRTLPFGTIVKVRNPKNKHEVVVKVTDRGPHQRRLMIDLSYSAASNLDIIRQGVAPVEMTILKCMPFVIPILYPLPIPYLRIPLENEVVILKVNDIHSSINQLND